MARSAGQQDYVSFVKGLITEASPLTFPENASIDEDNFVLNRDGSRQRRLGFDLEPSAVHKDSNTTYSSTELSCITTHEWESVNNNPLYTFVVVQFGRYLYFFDTASQPISGNYVGQVALTVRSGGTSGTNPVQVASGNGVLVVVGADFESQYIEASLSGSVWTFTTTEISIQVRDLIGIDDSLDIDENPSTLSDTHNYNLHNQGWVSQRATIYKNNTSGYPSNTQIEHIGFYTNINTGLKDWSWIQIALFAFATTPAPKGKYVIDAFDRHTSRETESGISGLPTDVEHGRPSTTTYHSSRIFYSGIQSDREGIDEKSPNYSSYIFFSPILTNKSKLGECFQEADPTAEGISDLLPTDGGTIQIPEADLILKLVSIGSSLLVVANNGVWEVKNGESGFAADDYIISKITERGALSQGSVIVVEGAVGYWNEAGIYFISPNEVSGVLGSKNVTETTIQEYYSNISDTAKTRVVSVYDSINRKVRWLYNDDSNYTGTNYKNTYNKELIFDFVLGAFYPHTISSLTGETVNPFIAGYIHTPAYALESQVNEITDDDILVTDDAVTVTDTQTIAIGTAPVNQYLVLSTTSNAASGFWRFSIGEYNNNSFTDWKTLDLTNSTGIDFSSFLITGYDLFGSAISQKQVPYIFFYFNKTEDGFTDDGSGNLSVDNPSSCLVRSRWDFSNSTASGKWGTQFEAYRLERPYFPADALDTFDSGKSVVVTKNSLRGSGKALSLHIESTAGKDMQVLGWSILVQGTTTP